MKRIILILGVLVSLAATHIVLSQTVEGVINYEVKVNMHRNLPSERQAMKNVMPEFRTNMHQLFFNNDESLYKPLEEDEEDTDFAGGGVRMRMMHPHVQIYFNHATSKRISQQEFMGKEYLIEDSLTLPPWKFGTDTKVVAGFTCKQAMYHDEVRKQDVIAWYTTELRPYLGPETFNTLPGAALEVDVNNSERVITAKSIDERALKKNELKIPHRGTKITRAQFQKMIAEHTDRMRANGANVIIRD
jgi:GLPGLI family protein